MVSPSFGVYHCDLTRKIVNFFSRKDWGFFCQFSAHLVLTGACQRVCSENNFAIMRGHEWETSIEYSNDLQFSRPWKEGNGLGCGQPWITLGKTHWQNKSGSGLRESLGYVWLRGYANGSIAAPDTWQLPRKASWGDPEIFQMFVRPTTNRNIQKSRHAVTWLQTKLLIGCMSRDMPDMWH